MVSFWGWGRLSWGQEGLKGFGSLSEHWHLAEGPVRFCKRGGEEEEGFSGSAARRRHAAFFLSVVKPLREKRPSTAAYFVSPDLQRHLQETINTTDGNLLLGQPSPSTAPQHFHVHCFQVATGLNLTGDLIPGFRKEYHYCLAV